MKPFPVSQFVSVLVYFYLFVFCSLPGQAQHLEAGLSLGTASYGGELAADGIDGNLRLLRPSAGIFGRYYFSDVLSVRTNVHVFRLKGDDALSDRARNLHFRSANVEAGVQLEINIPGYQPYALYRPFSPYLFAGIGFMAFNPEAQYEGNWIELQPLGTEGQHLDAFPDRQPYPKSTLIVPLGVGVKYALNDEWNLGVQAGIRLTQTDYLDDVSSTYISDEEMAANSDPLAGILANRSGEPVFTGQERGDPTRNDTYFLVEVMISYNFLDNGLAGSRNRSKKRRGCYN